ncbi:ABC transporter substrate-binding protein [Chitinimonas arctica]|uniref:ABC transporter substrate-binding protein n=1 Tax=Chitinimonas arctica TaxID=2594795 RepID=A0A516SKP7_9NEIS|nr:ABC transporter substrate-binding protein [Chitinimonas arctica]QDQ28730.1 ABC transporter substrate-binding protein [Chitinimonas arctica]
MRPTSRFLLPLLTAGLLASGQAAETVTIGHVGPVSSLLKENAVSAENTLSAYFEELNKKGGVNGLKIKMVFGDDGFNPQKYAEETRRIIQESKPIAMLGAAGSAGPLELIKQNILSDAKIPLIAPISGAPALRSNPFMFHMRASWVDEMNKLGQQMASLGHQRIGVFFQNDQDGKFGLFAARQEAKKSNLEVVATGSYEKNTVNVDAAVKAINEQNPTAVLLLGTDDASGAFLKAYRKAGGSAQMYTVSVVGAKELIAAAGIDSARGTGISQVMPYIYSDSSALVKEYRAFVKRNKLKLGYVEFEYFVAANVVTEALKKVDKREVNGETLMAAIEALGTVNLGGYRLTFGPNQHVGSKFVEVTVIGPSGELIR